MAHLADSKHRMHRFGHRRAVLVVDLPAARNPTDSLRRDVGAGEHPHHAGRRRSRRRIDPIDPGVRPIGALDEGVKLAGTVDVVGVGALAAEKANVLLATDGCADALESHNCYLPVRAARYSAA